MVTDASGTFNKSVRDAALMRMAHAGAATTSWFAVACELQRDWRNNMEGLDGLRAAQEGIENDLQRELQTLFDLDYDLLLYDLTSTYFEGLAEANELAARGYSRDHRRDCKQAVLALVVTRDGFPLAHFTPKGDTQDLATVQQVVGAVEMGDIVLETTDGRQLLLQRVARPDAEQKRILEALKLELPERLSPNRLL